MLQTLRRAGGSLVMTVPKAFIEQNHLHDGSQIVLVLQGAQLTIKAPNKNSRRYKLKDLLAEMPEEFPCVEGWDSMKPVGKEVL